MLSHVQIIGLLKDDGFRRKVYQNIRDSYEFDQMIKPMGPVLRLAIHGAVMQQRLTDPERVEHMMEKGRLWPLVFSSSNQELYEGTTMEDWLLQEKRMPYGQRMPIVDECPGIGRMLNYDMPTAQEVIMEHDVPLTLRVMRDLGGHACLSEEVAPKILSGIVHELGGRVHSLNTARPKPKSYAYAQTYASRVADQLD